MTTNEIPRTQKLPKLIPVGTADWALVDEEDYSRLASQLWVNQNGYARRSLKVNEKSRWGDHASIAMHREILGLKDLHLDTDHINHNGLDNRKCNLRVVTTAQNLQWGRKRFFAKPDRVTTSQFKGVSWRKDRQRWTAYVGTGKSRMCLGSFSSEESAARAYNDAAKQMHGEFAKLNDIP